MEFGATGRNAYKGSIALDFYACITHKISNKINFYSFQIVVRHQERYTQRYEYFFLVDCSNLLYLDKIQNG